MAHKGIQEGPPSNSELVGLGQFSRCTTAFSRLLLALETIGEPSVSSGVGVPLNRFDSPHLWR